GPHQVAQKSSTSTFPLNWPEVTVLPSTSLSVQDGAAAACAGSARSIVGGAVRRARATRNAAAELDMACVFPQTVAQGAGARKSSVPGVGEVQAEGLDELLHRRREDAAPAVEDGEGAG